MSESNILLPFTTNLALNSGLLIKITGLRVCRADLFILNATDMYLLKIDSYMYIVKGEVAGENLNNNFNFRKTENMLFLMLRFKLEACIKVKQFEGSNVSIYFIEIKTN